MVQTMALGALPRVQDNVLGNDYIRAALGKEIYGVTSE
jgi:hypothetical protein